MFPIQLCQLVEREYMELMNSIHGDHSNADVEVSATADILLPIIRTFFQTIAWKHMKLVHVGTHDHYKKFLCARLIVFLTN